MLGIGTSDRQSSLSASAQLLKGYLVPAFAVPDSVIETDRYPTCPISFGPLIVTPRSVTRPLARE